MEGSAEEHFSSTGIFDCDSDYSACTQGQSGWSCPEDKCPIDDITQGFKCPTPNRECFKDNDRQQSRFDAFWKTANKDGDNFLTKREISENVKEGEVFVNNCLI